MPYIGDYFDESGTSVSIKIPVEEIWDRELFEEKLKYDFRFNIGSYSSEELVSVVSENNDLVKSINELGNYKEEPGTGFYRVYMDDVVFRWRLVSKKPVTDQTDILGLCSDNMGITEDCTFNYSLPEKNLLIQYNLSISQLPNYEKLKHYLYSLIEEWKKT